MTALGRQWADTANFIKAREVLRKARVQSNAAYDARHTEISGTLQQGIQSDLHSIKAAVSAGDFDAARTYYGKLVELTAGSDGTRPEIAEARAFIEEFGR